MHINHINLPTDSMIQVLLIKSYLFILGGMGAGQGNREGDNLWQIPCWEQSPVWGWPSEDPKIMTWAEIRRQTLSQLSRPGAPPRTIIIPIFQMCKLWERDCVIWPRGGVANKQWGQNLGLSNLSPAPAVPDHQPHCLPIKEVPILVLPHGAFAQLPPSSCSINVLPLDLYGVFPMGSFRINIAG